MDWKIYELISQREGISVQELTRLAGTDEDTVTRTLRTLEDVGLITCKDDRVYPVKWTELLPSEFE